jgi:hypothetical protein
LVDVQTIGVAVTAASVTVAAIYYIINLRETLRNRRVTLANNLMQTFVLEEGSKRWVDLMNMEWKDYDDFQSRYGSKVNPENFAKRNAMWNTCNILGNQYRAGLIDMDTIFACSFTGVALMWAKFKPIIDVYRGSSFSREHYKDFEYLASELAKMIMKVEPTYKGNPFYFGPEVWEKAFPTASTT